MTDLVARLREAIGAAEAMARKAAEFEWGWKRFVAQDAPNATPVAVSQHIARHDPAAVLRRCAADRKILSLHRSWDDAYPDLANPEYPERGCVGCGFDGQEERVTEDINRCPIVLALAEAYGIEA